MNILVAEDEADIRRLIRLHLEERAYRIYEAKDGVEALELFARHELNLAILDVMMPRLDGFNLLREIRRKSHIPVIFLTARNEEMDKVLGLGLGADDYLVKPFSQAELVARVEAQLRRRHVYDSRQETPPEEVLEYRSLQLQLKECKLYVAGERVPLPAKEYKLLALLMRNPNRIFTKKQLYEQVWEDEYCYDDNTLMVTVSRLRNKIEPDAKNPEYILLQRGLGYMFRRED
ncbi:Sensory transduction protein regX3 [compost metagenome]